MSNKQYSYDEMSNKVIRSGRRDREDVNTNPTSLVGQISVKDMGSRVVHQHVQPAETDKSTKKAKPSETFNNYHYTSGYDHSSYHPTTEENAHYFDLIMTQVRTHLPDTSHEVILSAADTILEILKQEELGISQKKAEINEILEEVDDVEMNELVNLANRITDYEIQEEDEDEDGVAVNLEDDEEDVGPDVEEEEEVEVEEENSEEVPEDGKDGNIENEITIESKAKGTNEIKLIPLHDIDQFYLQRKVSKLYPDEDPTVVQALLSRIHRAIGSELSTRDLENELMEITNYDHFDLVKECIENRWRLHFKIAWSKADSEEQTQLISDMEKLNLYELAQELSTGKVTVSKKRKLEETSETGDKKTKTATSGPQIIDLEAIKFDQGSHLMSNSKVKLPKGSYQQTAKSYDTIFVPPPEPAPVTAEEKLVAITEMPEWTRAVFPSSETMSLNRIQSKIYPSAFKTDENLLLCAPTGAGKTNVAMLTVLRAIENHRDSSGKIDLKSFKIVYIAPLKALVQEQMREFERRLTASYGIVVNELTGDSSLSQQQIAETQIIVTTPEKWDIITRKSADLSSTVSLTKLIIIDEIHLLHDERGPVLESIVSRTLRYQEATGKAIRLVGLSATLPNYEDVAKFLRVDFNKGLFYFDSTYRPCPLGQQFIGIKEKKAIKKVAAMNEACYEKMVECMNSNHQLIIFVHSRKDTFKTAQWLKNKMAELEQELLLKPSAGSFEILKQEGEAMKDRNLKEIIPSGFGIHHAGLNKQERNVVEDLFAQGHVKVLVSTATLAWGVNLPAHTVIIKGTETYSPEKGTWVQLSPQDILQMLGRAGRPRYDKSGEGIIITSHDELQYYLAILNQQLPIESQFVSRLVDNLNAEVVLGTIRNRDQGVEWLGYTYLFIRMLKSPALYHVGADKDPVLLQKRENLIHTAFTILQKNKLVEYQAETGEVKPTELGKIASHYYINYETMNMYNTKLKPWLTEIDLLKIFASSGEFKYVPVRQEEKLEITKLVEKCPIPIKESVNDPVAKVNVLLQTYISRLTLDGFALMADMIYVTQSAGRLLRAIFEIVYKKQWSALAKTCLNLCKSVEQRIWLTSSPFRQFGQLCPREIIRVTESSHLPWISYFNLDEVELSEALNLKGNSHMAYNLLQKFPKLDINYYCQPITDRTLRVQAEILPNWEWSGPLHGSLQNFYVWVEDCNGDKILYSDQISIRKEYVGKEHFIDFTLEMSEPLQPNYFLTLISDKWLHSEWRIPIELSELKFPKQSGGFMEVLDLQNVPTSSLPSNFGQYFTFNYFNKFQSQVFPVLFNSNDDIFIGLSKGGGKTTCAECAILNHWRQNINGRVLYVNPSQELVDKTYKIWSKKFKSSGNTFAKLTGETASDVKLLNQNHVILATPEQFNLVSKRWRQRKVIHSISLLIADDLHKISGGDVGATDYEVVVSRMRLIGSQFNTKLRVVGLSNPVLSSRDLGEWIGCTKQNIFNFDPSERFNKIDEIKLQASDLNNHDSFIAWGTSAAYSMARTGPSVVFVSSRKECINVATKFMQKAASDSISFLKSSLAEIQPFLDRVSDPVLQELLSSGIGYYHQGMNNTDRLVVEKLFDSEAIATVFAAKVTCAYAPAAAKLIVLGTQTYEGKEHRYVDYSISDMLEMVGCCKDGGSNQGKVLILTSQSKLKFYQQFLADGLPVESYLHVSLHDYIVDELSNRSIKSKQDCIDWITFTYFYRRLRKNPSFYDVKDTSNLGVSEYLSELIETVLKELEDKDLVEIEGGDQEEADEEEEDGEVLKSTNATLIASHYNISHATMKKLAEITNKSKISQILETITSASELEALTIRESEPSVLHKIYTKLPIKFRDPDFESPYLKAFILLQAHLLRIPLQFDLQQDLKLVLKVCLNVICGAIDVLSSEGYLNAIQFIDLSQMVVQAVWFKDSPLKQVPNFDAGILGRCKEQSIETVYDIMSLEDDQRDQVLQLQGDKLYQVAEFVNKYPNIDIQYTLDLSEPIVAEEEKEIVITLERDEELEDTSVVSRLPFAKQENWWVVIGDSSTKQLYGIKKTTIDQETQQIKLPFSIESPGKHKLSIWCMCDSYVDADKEVELEVEVQ